MAEDWLKIGEVARRTGLTVRTLHHYDEKGLLTPSVRSGGDHRLYSRGDLRRLLAIAHLRSLGLSLAETRAALDDPAFDPTDALAAHIELVRERLAVQQALLDRLSALRESATAGWDEVLDAIALSSGLQHPEATVRFRSALDTRATPLSILLDQLADDPDPMVREGLTWAVAQHGSDALPALLARLSDADPVVRFQVVRAIGKLAVPEPRGEEAHVVRRLVPLLDDPEPTVRSEAADALGRIGGADALAALIRLLSRLEPEALPDPLPDRLVDILTTFGEDAVSPLVTVLAMGSLTARRLAVVVLGQLGSATALPALLERVGDRDDQVRLAALLALAGYADDSADEAIANAMSSDDTRLRALAARLRADRPRRRPRGGTR